MSTCHGNHHCNLPTAYRNDSDESFCILHAIEWAYSMHYGLTRNRIESIANAKARGYYTAETYEGPDGYLLKAIADYIALADRLRSGYEAGDYDDRLIVRVPADATEAA